MPYGRNSELREKEKAEKKKLLYLGADTIQDICTSLGILKEKEQREIFLSMAGTKHWAPSIYIFPIVY